MDLNSVKKYYADITSTNIIAIARELIPNRITTDQTKTSKPELQCDCPNHASESKKSLHISGDKQSWFCFGCGCGGDVLHFVEFIKFGIVSHGSTAGSSLLADTHKQARDWLAQYCNIPPLNNYGLSDERLKQGEKAQAQADRTSFVMGEILKYYHYCLNQKDNAKIVENLNNNYAIKEDSKKQLLIGFAPAYENVKKEIAKIVSFFEKRKITPKDLVSTGFFIPMPDDSIKPFFNGRIVFPYWSKGRVKFSIGRKTDQTPNKPWEQGKYKKLPVWNENTKNYICKSIKNDLLYNEDLLNSHPEEIIITEGITDCIALNSRGFASISPVTVRISENDWKRIIPKLRNVKTVYLCLDNEVSGIGLEGARKASKILAKHDIDSKIIIIPLGGKQISARKELKSKFNISGVLTSKEKKALTDALSESDSEIFEGLFHDSKTDPNEFFIQGGTSADFRRAIDQSITITGLEIKKIPTDIEGEKLEKAIQPIIERLVLASPITQERELNSIVNHVGKDRINFKLLKAQLADEKKKFTAKNTVSKAMGSLGSTGDTSEPLKPGSCLASIHEAEAEAKALRQPFTASNIAEKIADWFEANGGKFFYFEDGDGCLFFDNEIYYIDTGYKLHRRRYRQFLYTHTGLVDTTSDGRTVIETLANIAHKRGVLRKKLTWLHTDVSKGIIYFNLNNDQHEIARIDPDGVTIMKNGINADSVLLESSEKMKPITFNEKVDVEVTYKFLLQNICNNMSCSKRDSVLILLWISSFLFLDFVSTKPATRFEGGASSGKTTAAKIITTMLFGEQQQKRATDAANFADGSRNPLVCLDNIEAKQMTEGLVQFLLTSVTGITNEKRRMNSDTGTIAEHAKCLVNTTGIEALSGELSEVQTRTFTINFDRDLQSEKAYIDVDVLTKVKDNRNDILSTIMICTGKVLGDLKKGIRQELMTDIKGKLGRHDKTRCDDFLSIMFLMWEAFKGDVEGDGVKEINGDFKSMIVSLNETSKGIQQETNPIAQALDMLFRAFEFSYDNPTQSEIIKTKYQMKFREKKFDHVSARQLQTALSKAYREGGLSWPHKTAKHLAQRISNDMGVIQNAGFEIELIKKHKTAPGYYNICRSKVDDLDLFEGDLKELDV